MFNRRVLIQCVRTLALFVVTTLAAVPAVLAQAALSNSQRERIDSAVTAALAATGAPSASIAVVLGGTLVYEHAYGSGRLFPSTPATSAMRYSIGSVSKQFTAAAILLLAEERRLSLDDKVGRWLPELTRANEVSIRQLLSMTAGYQDYWPQDYVFPAMLESTTAQGILDRWARKPLDFDPGTKWQYSNTNYTIAGLIVERVSSTPLMEFLRQRVFGPLGMTSATDIDAAPLGPADAAGYLRHALGPPRPAPKEARGWLFGAAQLAMTARDLALWDISVIDQTVLKPASYRMMQTDVTVESGLPSRYGLGVSVGAVGNRRRIAHGGAVSGYRTANEIYPDDRAAIVVFTNTYPGAAGPESQIAARIAAIIFEGHDLEVAKALEQARRIFADLQEGKIDRGLFSPNANAYFSDEAIADFASSLAPLGPPSEFVQVGQSLRGGMTSRAFRIRCGPRVLTLTTFALPDGRLEQYVVEQAQ